MGIPIRLRWTQSRLARLTTSLAGKTCYMWGRTTVAKYVGASWLTDGSFRFLRKFHPPMSRCWRAVLGEGATSLSATSRSVSHIRHPSPTRFSPKLLSAGRQRLVRAPKLSTLVKGQDLSSLPGESTCSTFGRYQTNPASHAPRPWLPRRGNVRHPALAGRYLRPGQSDIGHTASEPRKYHSCAPRAIPPSRARTRKSFNMLLPETEILEACAAGRLLADRCPAAAYAAKNASIPPKHAHQGKLAGHRVHLESPR